MPSKSASDSTPGWCFRTKLRRASFGWRGSHAAIARIDAAVVEILAAARRDPVLAAEGAVLFLEKVSPAVCEVDSSSGALGNAVYYAVEALVPIIAAASAPETVRSKWLERLFNALQDDDPPYIESLGDHWGDLCVTTGIASRWADDLLPLVKHVVADRRRGVFAFAKGTCACYSALFKAGRHEELLGLLDLDEHPIWPYLAWGGRVLVSRGQVDEAIAYMQRRSGINVPLGALARFAEMPSWARGVALMRTPATQSTRIRAIRGSRPSAPLAGSIRKSMLTVCWQTSSPPRRARRASGSQPPSHCSGLTSQ